MCLAISFRLTISFRPAILMNIWRSVVDSHFSIIACSLKSLPIGLINYVSGYFHLKTFFWLFEHVKVGEYAWMHLHENYLPVYGRVCSYKVWIPSVLDLNSVCACAALCRWFNISLRVVFVLAKLCEAKLENRCEFSTLLLGIVFFFIG